MGRVWLPSRESGPADEVSRPVATAGRCGFDEFVVLNRAVVRTGVEADFLRTVVGDAWK